MRSLFAALAVLTTSTLSVSPAWADAFPGKCKCEAPGASTPHGAAMGAAVGLGALALTVGRARRRKR